MLIRQTIQACRRQQSLCAVLFKDPITSPTSSSTPSLRLPGLSGNPAQILYKMASTAPQFGVNASTKSKFGDWPANKVRSTFVDYFKEHGHTFMPSSSTIPYEDPTLLFANAGMNQVRRLHLTKFLPA
jgi:tRNA synthetases class II (A)